mmetsp:Transcript_2859/g.6139  ORF Transcript_2859/g.6139 Transcript_2859/m.6139 type:complete len:85 (+) Transcript_2859:73-327(+)
MGWLLSSELLLASSTLQGLFVAGWRLYGLRTLWTELILATMDKTLHTNFSESSGRTLAREHEWNSCTEEYPQQAATGRILIIVR